MAVTRTQHGRSGDPAIRRSGDPAIRRSGDPAIRRSGDPAIRRSGDPAIRRSGDPAIRRSGDPAIRRSGDPAIRRSGDPAIRRSGDPAIRRSGDPAIRRSGDPAIRRSGDPAIRRSGDPAIRRSGDCTKGLISPVNPRFPIPFTAASIGAHARRIKPMTTPPVLNKIIPDAGPPERARDPSPPFVSNPRANGKSYCAPLSVPGGAWRSPSSSPIPRD